ncbi:tryptophan-specific transport protein [Vibrio sp. JCM 19052]|nr:tryptophan-specific transport protein [Vibrio sp. JCM 19052]
MNKSPSVYGGACIIACVCVGAGMLGLPTAASGAWTWWALLILFGTMIIMTFSGWLLLEAYSSFPYKASFSTVTETVLGKPISIINNLAVYFVGGILLYATLPLLGWYWRICFQSMPK